MIKSPQINETMPMSDTNESFSCKKNIPKITAVRGSARFKVAAVLADIDFNPLANNKYGTTDDTIPRYTETANPLG